MAKQNESINLNNINIQIIRSKRRRTSQIEIRNKQVVIRAPHYLPQFLIKKFVKDKYNWISKHLNQQSQQPTPKSKQFVDGEHFLLLDTPFTLHTETCKSTYTHFSDQKLTIGVPSRVQNTKQYVRKKMEAWYKETALNHIQERTAFHAKQMGGTPTSIKVREYKRRWGSCSSQGALSFNWRIIMAPPTAIDYVVIHELAHLQEFNHSKKFWTLIEQVMPDYKTQIKWFKNEAAFKLHF